MSRLDFPVIHKGFAFQMGKLRHGAFSEFLGVYVRVGELSFEVLDAGSASGSGSRSVKFSLVLVTTCVYGPETRYHNQNKNNLT